MMNYRLLGRSGLRVSELCLGCGTFGTNWGTLGSDETESRRVFDRFAAAGGNFLDTSNRYQEGQSETFVGHFVRGQRDRFVIGTKYSLFDVTGQGNDDPNASGNHRKNLVRSVEASLKRMGTDYIDLLWIHIPDFTTPVDEMLHALDGLVRQGKVLYVGASNFPAWWIARANTIADFQGWAPFIATQIEWTITERSAEPEFFPMAAELDLGIVAWSALGGGIVTGKYNSGARPPAPEELRRLMPHVDPKLTSIWHDATKRNVAIMENVAAIAREVGRSVVQVVIRWMLQQKVVAVPILSARTPAQMEENLGALEFTLADDVMARLDEASLPAIASPLPWAGPCPYPMLEFGSPALPAFFSRALLFAGMEQRIVNHRRRFGYRYRPQA
jgi:aryl-alcohol dehydrogenase-like predicted oxidoreductase